MFNMKFFLLAATATALVATGAHAQEYSTFIDGSKQVTEINFADEGARLRCAGPADGPCDGDDFLYKCGGGENMCCTWTGLDSEELLDFVMEVELPGYGKCSPADAPPVEDEAPEEEEVPQFLRGIALESSKCQCNKNSDCGSSQYCMFKSCGAKNGYTKGFCMSQHYKKNKTFGSCNHKQCVHKKNKAKCSCSSNQLCVKGNGYSCVKRGNDNACCVNGEVAKGYFLG